jgi:hypothetical protein
LDQSFRLAQRWLLHDFMPSRIYTDWEPRKTRTNTKGNKRGATLGQAKLALHFQIPSQASLRGIVKTHRPLAPRASLLFRALREMLGIWEKKIQGCDWLAKRGDVLGKHPKARLRVSFQNSFGIRATNQPWDFGATNWFLFIRVNP